MKFDDPRHEFPRFGLYVSDFGHLTTNRPIVKALVTWGKMTETQAQTYLTPGSGPSIVLVERKNYSPKNAVFKFPLSFDLDIELVKTYETTSGKGNAALWGTGSGKRVARVGVAMLEAIIRGHLRVFSPDDDDRDYAKALPRVVAFEDEVYGGLTPTPGTSW
jgi:hypothetical protein